MGWKHVQKLIDTFLNYQSSYITGEVYRLIFLKRKKEMQMKEAKTPYVRTELAGAIMMNTKKGIFCPQTKPRSR